MDTDFLPLIIFPAVINLGCTIAVFITALRKRSLGLGLALFFFVVSILALTFWPHQGPRRNSPSSEMWAYGAIVGVTFAPGALLALFGARRQPRARTALMLAAVIISVSLGAVFVFTALAFVCAFLGDCL